MEITNKKFGYLISAHLSDKRMSQSEFAEKMGLSQSTVSSWIVGKCYTTMDRFTQMLEVLNLTPNQFFQLDELSESPKVIYRDREVEKIVYRDREGAKMEQTEWVMDYEGTWYCKACRADAMYNKDGTQRRTAFCPVCGRIAVKKGSDRND